MQVDADIARGLPAFYIVGLGDSSVQESKERVRSAIKNSGADFPMNRKTVNLAPAHIRKHGPAYDLPIAVALLAGTNQILSDKNSELDKSLFIGELSLGGLLREINGILPVTAYAKKAGFKKIFLPKENIHEAMTVKGIEIYGMENLTQLIEHLKNRKKIEPAKNPSYQSEIHTQNPSQIIADMIHIKGQHQAKRALMVAAAGNHHLLMSGPPGVGKTLLGKFLANLLPPLNEEESIETTSIYSIKGLLKNEKGLLTRRPFREIHQTISTAGLIGGGNELMPGEISLAHSGVLFLDEINEFGSHTLETLRQPIEEKEIRIQRAGGTIKYPANFLLVGTMNPCPCGMRGSNKECFCTAHAVDRHRKRLSGPLLDRIDLFVKLEAVQIHELFKEHERKNEYTDMAEAQKKIQKAREMQKQRYENLDTHLNGDLKVENLFLIDQIKPECKKFLEKICENHELSARSSHRLLKAARTIADLDESEKIEKKHIFEASQYTVKAV